MQEDHEHFKFWETMHIDNSDDENGNDNGEVESVGSTEPEFISDVE